MGRSKFILGILLVAYSNALASTDWDVSGGVVAIHQGTDEAHIQDQNGASIDFILSRHIKGGELFIHFEGATTPNSMSVATILPEANSDAGTALDNDDKGRFQLSQLYYSHTFNMNNILTIGLLDISGFFEQSRIASDESTQFLGTSFTGNPTIDFPDYTIGLVYQHAVHSNVVLRAALTSAKGIADNNARSYSQLLSLNDNDDGIFAITSVTYNYENFYLRAGTWINTSDHSAIDGNRNQLDNYGAYAISGYKYGKHAVNIRLGHARETVSRGSNFVALSYQYLDGAYLFGAGAARIYLSSKQTNQALDDTNHYEAYLRYSITDDLFVTGDIQNIDNSDFGELSETQNKAITLYGVRLSYLF